MTPPRSLWHVEWRAARRHDLPHQRVERARTFRSEQVAARQVRSVQEWEASHTELIGVWVAVGFDDRGVQWERLDDIGVAALVDVLSASDDQHDLDNQEEP